VENTKALMRAAKAAGVRRFVHVSICNPSEDSPLAYYKGKAELERFLRESGLSYAILRPTVIFGNEDILINNIAWMLRRFPVFAVPGDGRYRIQPLFVEDMARLAVEAGERIDDMILDAVGPEIFTFDEIIRLIGRKIGRPARLVHLPPVLVYGLTSVMGYAVKDVILTWEEIKGLLADLLVSSRAPTGTTRFSEWLHKHSSHLGIRYSSEIARHFLHSGENHREVRS
jgi:NADH dehydrogenase